MSVEVGTRLGSLQITALLGKGGMGEVYRARDTKLKRDVAIKILPNEFSCDMDRVSRFQREAQVLASLNHPNIAAIYDLQEADGFRFLILELIEGETLADRIARGPIPLEEALDIAKYICEALEAAHEKGITHRDLKPANVKITPEGTVKVLDFGLAKVAERQVEARLMDSPTLTAGVSQAGVILGTAAYMAPEQARGKAVDKRADIWAFGVVLFEMVTGRRLFQGEDASETLAAVIKEEPPWELAPARVRRLLQSCLEKNPKRRLRDIGDAWRLLDDTPQSVHASRQSWLAWSAAALCAVLAAIAFWAPWRRSPPAPEPKQFQILLPEKTSVGRFAVSPDGRWIAFAGRGADDVSRLWVRAIDSLEVHPLRGTEGVDPVPPFWSPDSRFIAFGAARKLKKIDTSGGPPQNIADLPGAQTLGGSWNEQGVIIFGTTGPLMRVPASGGVPSPVTALDDSREENRHLTPVFLPDGRHFLYLRVSNISENSGIYIGSLDSAPAQQNSKLIVATVFGPAYVPSTDPRRGHLLFLRDQVLISQTFDVTRLELTGEPVVLAEQVSTFFNSGLFSASLNGVLVYRTGTLDPQSTQLTWFDAQGKPLGTAWEPALYGSHALAPDDTRAAVSRLDLQGGGDIWIVDFVRNANSRFTFESGGISTGPVWSPDGTRIIFRSNRDGVYNLYWKPVSGVENEKILLKSGQGKFPTSWSHDGRFLLYHTAPDPKRKNDLWMLPLDGDRKPVPLVATEFDENDGRFSPDGHFVAYVSDESGRPEIYVREFSGTSTGRKWQVSNTGGSSPRWRRDGKALFYLAADGTVMQVDVNTSAVFQTAAPQTLFKLPPGVTAFDITGDGKRFFVGVPVEQDAQTPFTVALNWEPGTKK
jgi:Tol biopolymer transport system component